MPNWKELGEVPDSDEDDFDGPSPPQSPIAGLPPAPPPPIASPLTDIWSIPSSPARQLPEPCHQATLTTTAVPLGIKPNTPLSCSSPLSPPPPDVTSSPTPSPEPEPSRQTIREGLQITLPAHPVPSDTLTGAQSPLVSESISHLTSHSNDVSPSRQAAVRLERSLRPRKPIQEHPYLLEGAQYTRFMKAHGFKPLRVVTEQAETSRRRTNNEDSQDNDFSADESQSIFGELQEHKSQPLGAACIVEERDELALSPSPRASSQVRAISSGRPSPGQDTAPTSPAEDDLPSIDELLRQSRKTRGKKQSKRPGSTSASSSTKRRRVDGSAHKDSTTRPRFKPPLVVDLEASPLAGQDIRRRSRNPQAPVDTDLRSPTKLSLQTPSPTTTPLENDDAPAVISISDDDVQAEGSDSPDSSGTDSDSDAMQKHVRRIRGVLPASWLRLDQLKAQKASDGTSRRQSPPSSPKQLPRKGVALPKQRPQQPTSSNALFDFLYNDDDDDHDERINNDISLRGNPSLVSPPKTTKNSDLFQQLFLDDGDIPEEDVIDRMVTGTKRKRKDSSEPNSRNYRKHNSGPKNPRQQKITTLLDSRSGGNGGIASKKVTKSSRSSKTKTARRSGTTKGHPTPPPMLSVLDVVESDAPRFLRIAARAARRAPNRGKTSPSRKQINLGSRPDNIDALSVLRDWKNGRIRPKVSHELMEKAATSSKSTSPRLPLMQSSTNPPRASAHLKRATSLGNTNRRTKQTRLDVPVSSAAIPSTAPIVRELPKHLKSNSGIGRSDTLAARPAQLETTEVNRSGKFGFLARKRNLDASYRRNKSSLGPAAARLDRFINSSMSLDLLPTATVVTSTEPPKELQPSLPRRPRLRKQTKARFVDITAPLFLHAADPLPAPSDYALVHEDDVGESSDEKLRGLGPFGTHYTHHFEVFPLDANVYFHESTFIGMGKLSRLQDKRLMDKSCHVRPSISFQLGDKTLRWGPWDETTSSELGVLVDFVVDEIVQPEKTLSIGVVAASDFLLNFVETGVSFEKSTDMSSFMSRVLDVLRSFIDRVEAALNGRAQSGSSGLFRTLLQVLPRILMVNLLSTRFCQQSSVLSDQGFQAQEVLRRLAKVGCRILVSLGLGSVEETYADLQQLRHREHGIKSDRDEVVVWVVLMRILQAAELPRGGFWDILGSVILTPELTGTSDLKRLEYGWKLVFTLLPLTEFNDMGTLDAGSRLRSPLDGWAIPQALLKRTFHIYQKNPRQPPSFNDYCRSLMGRCHYLINQWGWGKCTGMVGLVFDFFGSQNLSHLRNEEVYKSPSFLEQLSGKPDVSIHAEDRCFHIFVKIVAMVIRRLRGSGLVRDIKNLVTRIVPNHSRQFLKEQTINQHELAALRNHHDLLCALFWAAPPNLRPGIHLIEKLVTPGSSHREAVLINLRAWSQLSRFVVSSNEGASVYRPFISWQNNIFRQTLDQYLTAETDIQQQLLALSKDASNEIDRDTVRKMIEKNQAAAMDILYCSVQASLEVLKVAPSLSAATYSLNTKQLSQAFTKLDVSCAGFDWQTLLVALDVVGRYIDRIDDALDYQDSCNSETAEEQNASDEAIQLVDDHIVEALFSVANQVLNLLETRKSERIGSKESLCAEKAIVLSGRDVYKRQADTRL